MENLLDINNLSQNDNSLQNYLKLNNINYNFNKNDYTIQTFNNNKGILNINNNQYDFFTKFCPLVDPIKFISNSYNEQKVESNISIDYNNILNNKDYFLPLHNDSNYENNMKKLKNKINYPMNCAYIDSFFTILTNQINNKIYFPHNIKIYDTFTCVKNNFSIDIGDSIDCIDGDNDVLKNVKNNFVTFNDPNIQEMYINSNHISIDSLDDDDFFNDSKKKKPKLNLNNTEEIKISFDEINDSESLSNNKDNTEDLTEFNISFDSISDDNTKILYNQDDESTSIEDDNSNESFTDDESIESIELINSCPDEDNDNFNEDENEDNEDNEDDEDCESSIYDENDEDDEEDPEVFIKIKQIPVQTIIMEKYENTLDDLLENEEIDMNELKSALFQIVMILLIYQKAYKFTHNDLHTNNIMYNDTDIEFLYYKIDNKIFKVPTFGKIYKIIDFGRSIFIYDKINFASDSFNKNEDADTQYNCEPFFDENFKRIDNNFSFDLCRLGCSLFDFFIDDIDDVNDLTEDDEVIKLIVDWVTDDNNKNILYKSNGETRYPGFKIYKMIARNVHNHIPENEINKPLFNEYIIQNKKNIKKILSKKKIINIDEI